MLNQIDLSRADHNLLVLFEVVLQEGHVGQAAARLNLSPSAVSHGLGRLRRMLGDPLFLRTPRGVSPTDRALELAAPIAEILARVRGVMASSAPFDPAVSRRRFTIGAPDGVSAVLLPPLLRYLRANATGIDISVRQILPRPGEPSPERAWSEVTDALDARAMDVAIIPVETAPARFETRVLYEEDFVIAARAGHAFVRKPSLEAYCAAEHLVVSDSGDPLGFVDAALAERGLSRRVAMTAPNFMFALAVLADTDLIAALPRKFVAAHGARFDIATAAPPVTLPAFRLTMVTPKVALNDAGIAWLADVLSSATGPKAKRKKR